MKLSIVSIINGNSLLWRHDIQHIRTANDCTDVEFVALDMLPEHPHAKRISAMAESGFAGASRYVAGTRDGSTLQQAAEAARGPAVLVLSPGAILFPGVVPKLIRYFADHPDSKDIVTGPMVGDNLRSIATHMRGEWHGREFGQQATAWETPDGRLVGAYRSPPNNTLYHVMPNGEQTEGPDIKWSEHATRLVASRWSPLGNSPQDSFAIPAQRLDVFAFMKPAWPALDPNIRGLGGEEFYLHDLFRANGGQALCLGFMRWALVTDGAGRSSRDALIRNILIGLKARGLSTDDIARAVGEHKLLTPEDWERVSSDPVGYKAKSQEPPPTPETGPGEEIGAILASLGAKEKSGCGGCANKRRQMNVWGVKGCRAHYWEIVGWFRDGQANFSTVDKVKAAAWAAVNGLAWKIESWDDPFPSLVTLAIDRAEVAPPTVDAHG